MSHKLPRNQPESARISRKLLEKPQRIVDALPSSCTACEIYALMKTRLHCQTAGSVCFVSRRRKFAQIVSMQPRCERSHWCVTPTSVFKLIDSRHDARLVPDRCCPNTIDGIALRQTNWHLAGHVKHSRGRWSLAPSNNNYLLSVCSVGRSRKLELRINFSTSGTKNLRKFRSGRTLNGAQSGSKCSWPNQEFKSSFSESWTPLSRPIPLYPEWYHTKGPNWWMDGKNSRTVLEWFWSVCNNHVRLVANAVVRNWANKLRRAPKGQQNLRKRRDFGSALEPVVCLAA